MEDFAPEVDEATELAFARVAVERITRSSLLSGPAQEAARAFAELLARHAWSALRGSSCFGIVLVIGWIRKPDTKSC